MMLDIFSNFDPAWYSLCYKNSFMYSMVLMLTLNLFWLKYNKMNLLMMKMNLYISTEMMYTKLNNLKSMLLVNSMLFFFIIFMNISGLMPYMFSSTSHIIFTASLSVPLWMFMILSSMMYSKKNMIAHFLPDSAPIWLNPFLVLIETSSTMVRPMTLMFRLAANMTAGHIIMTLMSSMLASTTTVTAIPMLMMFSSFYLMFELGICLIQAYIFCLLISLYTNDHA